MLMESRISAPFLSKITFLFISPNRKACVTFSMSVIDFTFAMILSSSSNVKSTPDMKLIREELGKSDFISEEYSRFVSPMMDANVFGVGYSSSSLTTLQPVMPEAPKTKALLVEEGILS
jgi:hypothetical protein